MLIQSVDDRRKLREMGMAEDIIQKGECVKDKAIQVLIEETYAAKEEAEFWKEKSRLADDELKLKNEELAALRKVNLFFNLKYSNQATSEDEIDYLI